MTLTAPSVMRRSRRRGSCVGRSDAGQPERNRIKQIRAASPRRASRTRRRCVQGKEPRQVAPEKAPEPLAPESRVCSRSQPLSPCFMTKSCTHMIHGATHCRFHSSIITEMDRFLLNGTFHWLQCQFHSLYGTHIHGSTVNFMCILIPLVDRTVSLAAVSISAYHACSNASASFRA
jgi:hypothetical protein